ncbi:hypothetical protein L2E82_32543 [Cichorium intybus]|uniref:Uncharacterized protein n=1 Tax=Cichorium intybus TaxID=13427 RepID=A0ACB9BHH8_CICIN|nr:hypothetical protein L2E82_32543 [Cichorium intybus]
MTQLTSLMAMMANNFMPEYQQMSSRGQEEEEEGLKWGFDPGFSKQAYAAPRHCSWAVPRCDDVQIGPRLPPVSRGT